MKRTDPTPVAARLFYVLAVLAVFATVGIFLMSPKLLTDFGPPSLCGALIALALFGLSQIIEHLGRTAYFTEYHAARTEEQHQVMSHLAVELNKQTALLTKLLTEADETAGDRFSAAEDARKFYEKSLAAMVRAEARQEHTNQLLKWLGELKSGSE